MAKKKQKTLKQQLDGTSFYLSKKKGSVIWTVIGKSKGVVTIQSMGGSTRFVPLSTKIFPV